MNRDELEALDRDTLIRHAEASGVPRARVLTRPELVDELLLRQGNPTDPRTRAARGLFGRARDLLARVIERGLHLPDAAEMVRATPKAYAPPPASTAAVPTVTLAEIYAAQGHKDRAMDTLRRVLEGEPEHAAARSLLTSLEGKDLPPPILPPEQDEPALGASEGTSEGASQGLRVDVAESDPNKPFLLDDEPLPHRYDVDECVAIPVDPTTMFVYWEMRESTRAHLEKTRPGGHITLRALVVVATWDGPRVEVRDFPVNAPLGDWFIRELPRGAVVRAAVGWQLGGAFVPSAHSPALETLVKDPSPLVAQELVRWTPEGVEPLGEGHGELPLVQRAMAAATARLRRESAEAFALRAAGLPAPGRGADGLAAGVGVSSMAALGVGISSMDASRRFESSSA